MKKRSLFKLALSEIRNNKKFALFFILNLALGLSGFVILDIFKDSLAQTLNQRSKAILAADLEVGARRPLTDEEIQITESTLAPYQLRKTRTLEMYSMLSSPTSSRLVELRAIEEGFPFYGEIELAGSKIITSTSEKDLLNENKIWLYPETLLQLNLKVGDAVNLGGVSFVISETVVRDGGGVGSGFSFALPVYIGLKALQSTALYQKESTGYHSYLYQLKPEVDSKLLASELFKKFKDPAVRVTTHHNASEQIGRALSQLSDYLGLASLIALFLTALGTTFLFRSYLSQRVTDIATLKTLGFQRAQIEVLYFIQILTLGLLAALPLLALTWFVTPLLIQLSEEALQFDIEFVYSVKTAFVVILSATLGSFLICYPLIFRLRDIQPKKLFQGGEFQENRFQWSYALAYLPAAIAYLGLSFFLSKSFQVTGYFALGLLLSFAILAALGQALLIVIQKWLQLESTRRNWSYLFRLSLTAISRQRISSLALFLSLSLGVMLMNLIPQIQNGLQAEVQQPSGVKIPSLFLFDIQPDQVANIKSIVEKYQTNLISLSPMIRARLDKVNGEPFARVDRNEEAVTREEENENRFRNRGFNLTYRNELTDAETLIAGQPILENFQAQENSLPLISLEERFANRLKLKIGDILSFDIQGINIEGQVANLRKVKWTSFQPNFFIQFQSGVLEDAPQTFLAAVPQVANEVKNQVQNDIVKEMPTVSIIDVSKVIERISGILSQMSLALQMMAFLSVLVGLSILFSIANQQAHQRKKQVNLLKVTGASFQQVTQLFLFEFAALSLIASFVGVTLSLVFSWVMSVLIFDTRFVLDLQTPALTIASTLLLTVAVTYFATRRVLQSEPKELLQA